MGHGADLIRGPIAAGRRGHGEQNFYLDRRGPHLQPETPARPGDENVRVVVRGDGTVVGRVQLEDGTAPGRFAVELERGAQTAFTAPDGAFALSAPAGTRDLTVTGPAFATTRRPDVEVREGARSDVGVIRVARGRSITGRVFGAGGAPVAGALVVAGMQLSGGGRQLYIPSESRGAQETTSDDEGHYTLAGFAPGPLVVVADREGEGRSATIPVPRGAASAQVDLVLRATGSLEGRITRDGRPFPDTVVIVSPQLGLSNFFVTSGPDGRYALDALAPGPQILIGFLNRHKDMTMRGVTIEAGRRAQADLAVRTGTLALRARVQAVEDGSPIPPAQVVLLVAAGALEVRDGDTLASLRDRPPPETPTTMYRRAGRGGALEVDGLPPGSYTACVAVGPGGIEMEAAPLRCARHELAASGEVVLSVPRGWAEAVAKR